MNAEIEPDPIPSPAVERQIRDLLAAGKLPPLPSDVRLGPAVARPGKLVCIGLNYRDHASETGAETPSEPVMFMKATTAICGPEDDLILPPDSRHTDWEIELAFVIGLRARRISAEEAGRVIAGYTIMIDYSERRWQKNPGGQWTKGKSFDRFAPLGPCLVTADEIPDPQALRLTLSVNGEVMQSGTTADMIFPVRQLVAEVSRYMTLEPGDVISTGTPAGVGMGRSPARYLQPGDLVESEIEGLGHQRQRVLASHP